MAVTDRPAAALAAAPALLTRVSWGAIFGGAVIAVALTALFGLLGLGIGFGSYDPAQGDALSDAPKATLLWWAVTTIVATGIGGFVAARLAGIPRGITGALHGLAVWAVATLLTLWLATSAVGFALGAATNVVTTTAKVTSGAVTTVGGAAISAGGAVAPNPSQADVNAAKSRVQQEADRILTQAGVGESDMQAAQNAVGNAAQNIATNPGTAEQEINRLINRLFEGPNAVLSPQERDRLVTAIANRAGMSRPEAERVADRWQGQANAAWSNIQRTSTNTVDRLGEEAVDVADDTVDILSKVAWGMFLISLAGLVAAMIGAALGGATLGLGLLAAGAAYDEDDRDYDRDGVIGDRDEDLDRRPPPRTRR